MKKIIQIFIILSSLFITYSANSQVACDSVKYCIGNRNRALTFTETYDSKAQYVEVVRNPSIQNITEELTVEMRLKAGRQAGVLQFVAGLWGPAEDVNDVWVIYIDAQDRLTFEVNGPNTKLGKTDNTIISTDYSAYYNAWHTVTCVFNGAERSVELYVDGEFLGASINSQYPAGALRKLQNPEKLSVIIGGANALTNDIQNYRTFLGQIDEVKIWDIAKNEGEIKCSYDQSLNGNEPGLLMYWRCNQDANVFTICDATTNGNTGQALSGATCQLGNYTPKRTLFFEALDMQLVPNRLKDTIRCDESKTYRFRAWDTSGCNKNANLRVYDEFREKYTVTPTRINNMEKDQYYDFEVTIDADFTGTISNRIAIWDANNCYFWTGVWMDITRTTEANANLSSIDFGLLKAFCVEKPYIDTVITICNSNSVASQKNIVISGLNTAFPNNYQILNQLPVQIPPGECLDLQIRFSSNNMEGVYDDVLEILTNDACDPIKKITVIGSVREVFAVYRGQSSEIKLDSINFGSICLDFASDPVEYRLANLFTQAEKDAGKINTEVSVQQIILPPDVITPRLGFPIVLEPETGYQPEFFRYFPTTIGAFQDSIVFIVKSDECTIRYPVYVRGEGKSTDVSFNESNLVYGNVVVGQERTLTATIFNNSEQSVRLNLYVKRGEAFFISGSRDVTVAAKSTLNVNVIFRPSLDQYYEDELCFFEKDCFVSSCIPINGTGVFERFVFEPIVMETINVIGCQQSLDTITIRNNTSQVQIMSDFTLDDPSGRYSLVIPAAFPNSISLNSGESTSFILRYSPNDVTRDRADRAFIRFKTQDGINWNAKLYGKSVTPSIYVTERTTYGTIELGDVLNRTLIVENTSPIPIRIDSIQIPNGFVRLYPPASFDGSTLAPRDTFHLVVQFAPTEAKKYSGDVVVYSNEPCQVNYWGFVEGEAEVIPLEIPLTLVSFGFINPCDCEQREIALINRSEIFEMNIDSVIIDAQGITGGAPQYFTWTSSYYEANGSNLPYHIPAKSIDTLKIIYCPQSPSDRDSIDHSAKVHVYASGSGWKNNFSSYLTGKRALIFEPLQDIILFPDTRVNTFSTAQYADFFVPGVNLNPSGVPLKIDTITFEPDERVFSIDSIGGNYPIYIYNLDTLHAKVQFKPRSVRDYQARMVLHLTKPCEMLDTTILCMGRGFAEPYGLSFSFENPSGDTIPIFKGVHCDTIKIPLYSERKFPAEIVDIDMNLSYDTSKVELIGLETNYLNSQCKSYVPNYTIFDQNEFGNRILLKNFCEIDSLQPIFIAHFLPKQNKRDTLFVKIESLFFDTEEIILYELIVETPIAKIMIELTEIEIINSPDFGVVNVLDCNSQELIIINRGDNPTDVSELLNLPPDVLFVNSVPPLGTLIDLGDTCKITLQYCPTKKDTIEQEIYAYSSYPCIVNDTTNIYGSGYAPEYLVSSDISMNFAIPDTISGAIGDTITIPLYFEKDMRVEYNGTTYWMEDLFFDLSFIYNKRALKFLKHKNMTGGTLNVVPENGNLALNFENIDNLSAGIIAELTFLVVVPDSVISFIGIETHGYASDKIMFYDIIPYPQIGYFQSLGKCNLTYFQFTDKTAELQQNRPNPWNNNTLIEFTIDEKCYPEFVVYIYNGEIIQKPLDGQIELSPGTYSLELNSGDFPAGIYFYSLRAGLFQAQKSMILVK